MKSSRVSAATFVNFEESNFIFFASSKFPMSTIDSNVLIHVSNRGFEDPFNGEAPENGVIFWRRTMVWLSCCDPKILSKSVMVTGFGGFPGGFAPAIMEGWLARVGCWRSGNGIINGSLGCCAVCWFDGPSGEGWPKPFSSSIGLCDRRSVKDAEFNFLIAFLIDPDVRSAEEFLFFFPVFDGWAGVVGSVVGLMNGFRSLLRGGGRRFG